MAKKITAEHIRSNSRAKNKTAEVQSDTTNHREGTKTETAHKIWDKMFESSGDQMSRHEAIEAAISNAGMTRSSAATLFQNWRNEHGLVDHNNPGGAAALAQQAAAQHMGGTKSKRR